VDRKSIYAKAHELTLEYGSYDEGRFHWTDNTPINDLWQEVGAAVDITVEETKTIMDMVRTKVHEWYPTRDVAPTPEALRERRELEGAKSLTWNNLSIELKGEATFDLFFAIHDGTYQAIRKLHKEVKDKAAKDAIEVVIEAPPAYGDFGATWRWHLHTTGKAAHQRGIASTMHRAVRLLTGAEEDLKAARRGAGLLELFKIRWR
jgi:hypothetical protein